MPSHCIIKECASPAMGRGWCVKHYNQWYRYGDPLESRRIHGDDEARFWSRVDKNGTGGCWLWTGHVNPKSGYVQFRIGGRAGKMVLAHRWAYEYFVGPIPVGLQIDHVYANGCRHRHCVNYEEHLEPVTAQVNRRRQLSYASGQDSLRG